MKHTILNFWIQTFVFILIATPISIVYAQNIYTVAGIGTSGYNGDGIPATTARLNFPAGIGIAPFSDIYIADEFNNRIRKIDSSTCTISTIAGNGTSGFAGDGGLATNARLKKPTGVAVDALGNVYIADAYNSRIRKVNTLGIISTIAGTGLNGYNGDGIPATTAQLNNPYGVTLNATGTKLYIADYSNNRIRVINLVSGIISTVAGNGWAGFSGDGGLATNAQINLPYGVAIDASGIIYIPDYANHRIRKIKTGIISTYAGTGTPGFSGDGGAATSAQLNYPAGVTIDAAGNLYIADYKNQRIRKINTVGIISTYAGIGTFGYNGDGIPATTAQFKNPIGVVMGGGCLYIADASSNRVRSIGCGGPLPCTSPLPINLLSFTATNKGSYNLLEWETASEINNNYFTIEHSLTGLEFEPVATLSGAGNSNTILHYSFIDDNFPQNWESEGNIIYYRLKQTDFDGKYEYSNIIAVNINSSTNFEISELYPNPANDFFEFTYTGNNNKPLKLEVYNTFGQLVIEKIYSNKTVNARIDTEGLSNGMYIVKFMVGDWQELRKLFVKLK